MRNPIRHVKYFAYMDSLQYQQYEAFTRKSSNDQIGFPCAPLVIPSNSQQPLPKNKFLFFPFKMRHSLPAKISFSFVRKFFFFCRKPTQTQFSSAELVQKTNTNRRAIKRRGKSKTRKKYEFQNSLFRITGNEINSGEKNFTTRATIGRLAFSK